MTPEEHRHPPRHEEHEPEALPPQEDRWPWGTITWVAVATLIVLAGAASWGAWMLYDQVGSLDQPVGSAPSRIGQPEVGIVDQRMFAQERRAQELRRAQKERLSSYGWVDRERGVIHLPIERAMELLLEEER